MTCVFVPSTGPPFLSAPASYSSPLRCSRNPWSILVAEEGAGCAGCGQDWLACNLLWENGIYIHSN